MIITNGGTFMTKIAWLVDTSAGFTNEEIEKYPLFVVPMGVILNNQHYVDHFELPTNEFYEKLKVYGEGAKTTQPNLQSIMDMYEQIEKAGFTHLISVHPSSKLTGSYQNSVAASKESSLTTAVIDSRTGSYPEKKMILNSIVMIEKGQSFDEAVSYLNEATKKSKLYLQPKSMQQMKKSGRVSASQSFMASLLNIQLILELTEGVVIPLEKIRTKKKVFNRLVEIVEQGVRQSGVTEIAVLHAGDYEEASRYAEAIQEKLPNLKIVREPLVPVAGVHTGYGTVGIGWIE